MCDWYIWRHSKNIYSAFVHGRVGYKEAMSTPAVSWILVSEHHFSLKKTRASSRTSWRKKKKKWDEAKITCFVRK